MQKTALIVTNYIGFFHFLWDDIDLLNDMGYKVYAVGDNSKQENYTLDIMEEKNVTFIDIRVDGKSPISRNNYTYYFRIKEVIKEYNFDLIHCHTPIVGLLVRLAARGYRKCGTTKVVYTTHGLAYTHLSSKKEYLIYHTIENFASRFCDAIITINMEDFENAKKLCCKQVFYINGVGVNTDRFKQSSAPRSLYRMKLNIAEDKIMILAIGELSLRKNHAIIVDAIAKMPNKQQYVFAICGREMTEGGTACLLRDKAIIKGVDVRFLGFRSDIPEIIHCADIGVIPSIREGLGLAGIEILSAGIPLVGSDVQGIREYVVNGETGFLCNPYDIDAFTLAIERLSDKTVRSAMHQACVDMVEKFDKKKSVMQRKKIYNEILF